MTPPSLASLIIPRRIRATPPHVKITAIKNAATIYVLLDENPVTINDGCFSQQLQGNQLTDCPADYHSRASMFNFADGHAVTHKWNASTITNAKSNNQQMTTAADKAGFAMVAGIRVAALMKEWTKAALAAMFDLSPAKNTELTVLSSKTFSLGMAQSPSKPPLTSRQLGGQPACPGLAAQPCYSHFPRPCGPFAPRPVPSSRPTDSISAIIPARATPCPSAA